jgi:hypothetical protein
LFREASNVLSRFSGFALAAAFYSIVVVFPIPMMQRYFLGHPIAVVTTVLFCVALAQLAFRFLDILQSQRQFSAVADRDLLPESLHELAGLESKTPSRNHGHADLSNTPDAARSQRDLRQTGLIPFGDIQPLDRQSPVIDRVSAWLRHFDELPKNIAQTSLVKRLTNLLERQQRRGNANQLSEDMRDLADRDSDADHDVLQFVRVIVWAIPMLGFLGTVVGITQTLGGLDFTDGAAAVDRLKSGLYVAFDTTALGLVLSVVAIFLQFPVEKASRALLDLVDTRVGRLVPQALAETSKLDGEDPLSSLHQMTVAITRSVQMSVQNQAEVWRQTIDAAHRHWQLSAIESAEQLRSVLQESLGENLATTLKNHTDGLRRVQREGTDQIDNRWQQWQTVLSDNARVLLAHQKTLVDQGQMLAESHSRARELERLQASLDQNVRTLDQSLQSVDQGLEAIAGATSIADAMMTLAKAVDVLSLRISPTDANRVLPLTEVEQAIASARHQGLGAEDGKGRARRDAA